MNKFPRVYLAPISQYTNRPFRELCKKGGAEFTFAPLVNVTQIRNYKQDLDEIIDIRKEKKVGVQLFGSNPEDYTNALEKLDSTYKLNWIDINAGCPMHKIVKIGAGSKLLSNTKNLKEILETLKPFDFTKSIKIRLTSNTEKIIQTVSPYVDVIFIHGRTPKQMYSGNSNWEEIKKLKEFTSCFYVGNGDITSIKQGKEYISNKYCDGFMIGREAMKNPYVFCNKKKDPRKLFLEYYKLYKKYEVMDPIDLKQKAIQFFHSFKGAKELRTNIGSLVTEKGILNFVKNSKF